MKKLLSLLLFMVLAATLVLTGCPKAAPAGPIKIGVMYPLSGPLAMTGEHMVSGIKLGIEEAGYEVAGRKVELIIEDSGSMPDIALDKAKKLVEHDKVAMILGPLIGGTQLAVAPYMAKMGVPRLATHAAMAKLAEYDWNFRVGGSQEQFASAMGVYAYDQMGLRTITYMSEDTYDGRVGFYSFVKAFQKRGGKVIQEQYSPFPAKDFGPELVALKDADAVAAWHHGGDTPMFLTQFHEFGIRKRMPLVGVFHGSFFEPYWLHAIPPAAADAMLGELTATAYSYYRDDEISKRFGDAFKQKYGFTPVDDEAAAYVGMHVALEMLKATGGDTSPEKLREALLALKWESAEGPSRIDPATRCAIRDVYIVKLDKIGKEYVHTPVYTYKDVPPGGF